MQMWDEQEIGVVWTEMYIHCEKKTQSQWLLCGQNPI